MSTLSNFDSTVNSFYLAFYGRPADPAGLKFWSQQLAASNGELGAITQAFATSEEAQVRFGADSLGERIGEIYQQLFNRTMDADGLAYWTGVVEQGNASLADVSIAILNGARGSDATLSALRQKAADDFTAQVEASGTEYSGYASIEAARILVRAVTPNATEADVAQLVKSAVSFADTATKTPAVVEAIAVNTTLLALFDTTRGKGDPVALAQALADTAKAAAGDPVTLESLLRGGGMDKVLKVMPAAATLKDVVKALADGGLQAAVEVVYPTAPVETPAPTPNPAPAGMKLYFDEVAQGDDDHVVDTTTNVRFADVTFKYTGVDLAAGQHFEYSTDGKTWARDGMGVDTVGNTITIRELDLGGVRSELRLAEDPTDVIAANVTTRVQLRAVEGENLIADASEEIVYDGAAPDAALSFFGFDGKAANSAETLQTMVDVNFKLTGALGDGDFIEYRLQGRDTWVALDSKYVQDGIVTIPGIDLGAADQTIQVRVTDHAGNAAAVVAEFIDGPVAAVLPTFFVIPAAAGLQVVTNVEGTVRLVDGKDVAPLTLTSLGSEGGYEISAIGAQDKVAKGTIEFLPDGGSPIVAPETAGIVIQLGTNGVDTMSGPVVWGFEGDDVITGTAGDDSLFGGDGNDTIAGGTGADAIYGGAGGDLIDLGAGEDSDRVVYEMDDAAGPVFVNGGSTVAIDKITGFGIGDSLRISGTLGDMPVLGNDFLTGASTSNDWSIVRGSDVGDVFAKGDGATDDDYMVQWMEGEVVNSAILHNYGVKAPNLTAYGGGSTIEQVAPARYLGTAFYLASNPSLATILATNGYVNGVDAATFKLVDYRTGVEQPLMEHDAAPGEVTTHGGNNVHFKISLSAGVYKMSWGDETVMTSNGYLNAAEVYFAGGNDGDFYHRGFELIDAPQLVFKDVTRSNDVAENEGFVVAGEMPVRIHTGGGNDVVVDRGGAVTLVYDRIDEMAQDLVLGFGRDDLVLFEGEAADIDKNGDKDIAWVVTGIDDSAIVATTEGVVVDVRGGLTIGLSNTRWIEPNVNVAKALDEALDVGAIVDGDHLLILANSFYGDSSVLFLYQDADNSGTIEVEELSTVAMFANGELTTDNIQVVGFQQDDAVVAP